MRHKHSQKMKQSQGHLQSTKPYRKNILDDGIKLDDQIPDIDDYSEREVNIIEKRELNFETYRLEGRSLKYVGSIIKTNNGYRFAYSDKRFEKLDNIIKDSFFIFEPINAEQLFSILKRRGEKEENIFSVGKSNLNLFYLKLPDGSKIHLSWLGGGSDSESKNAYNFRYFVKLLKKLLNNGELSVKDISSLNMEELIDEISNDQTEKQRKIFLKLFNDDKYVGKIKSIIANLSEVKNESGN